MLRTPELFTFEFGLKMRQTSKRIDWLSTDMYSQIMLNISSLVLACVELEV